MNSTWKKIAIYPLVPLVAAATLGACSSDSDNDAAPTTTEAPAGTETTGTTEAPATPEPTGGGDGGTTTTATPGSDSDCFVHFFDSDDFDESDDNFELTEAGRYDTLDDRPGADQDWNDEADAIEVGAGATVTIWEEKNFEGTSEKLEAGSKNADIEEPSSIEFSCN